jgi:hypothetical protein
MAEDKPTSPHDALVRAIFGTPAHMAEELRAALPREVAALLDLASLRPLPAHFADSQGNAGVNSSRATISSCRRSSRSSSSMLRRHCERARWD